MDRVEENKVYWKVSQGSSDSEPSGEDSNIVWTLERRGNTKVVSEYMKDEKMEKFKELMSKYLSVDGEGKLILSDSPSEFEFGEVFPESRSNLELKRQIELLAEKARAALADKEVAAKDTALPQAEKWSKAFSELANAYDLPPLLVARLELEIAKVKVNARRERDLREGRLKVYHALKDEEEKKAFLEGESVLMRGKIVLDGGWIFYLLWKRYQSYFPSSLCGG